MTFNPESTSSDHWADAIYTWAQVENVPEEILGFVCFSNFLSSIKEDLSIDGEWSTELQVRYLEGCCDGNEAYMNVVRWATTCRDYMEGLYACEVSSFEVFDARDLGMYEVAMDILATNFDRVDLAKDLTEEIRKKTRKPSSKPEIDPNVN